MIIDFLMCMLINHIKTLQNFFSDNTIYILQGISRHTGKSNLPIIEGRKEV